MPYDAAIFMHGAAPTEKDALTKTLQIRLWNSAEEFRANSGPILEIIFMRFAEVRVAARQELLTHLQVLSRQRRSNPSAQGNALGTRSTNNYQP